MCNLYRMTKSFDEVANLFGRHSEAGSNFAAEIYPGYVGLVVTSDAVRTMTWGFPLAMKSKKTGQALKPKPVNNAREDKLGTAFWRDSFAKRRCVIPLTAWAEAEGEKGCMTRTWYSLAEHDLFAAAGVWRPTAEWGDAYSMVMVDGCEQMSDVHDRMPTIVHREDRAQWTRGTWEEALHLCQVCADPLSIDRTPETWFKAPKSWRLSKAALTAQGACRWR
ncbi:SOS response-associated peptidase [Novosphingobium sp. M1R2S20]|uniref:Abasic site processing protein n=1 Tax=Novosphingobium rhizovicinum TaxID=3228928 RepID=A0ABV3R8L0_9SPHN